MDPLARGVCMPPVRRAKVLENRARPAAVPQVSAPNLGHPDLPKEELLTGFADVFLFGE